MNLVNELQVSAEQDVVLTVLCKAKRLASKLDRSDITEWLRNEQTWSLGLRRRSRRLSGVSVTGGLVGWCVSTRIVRRGRQTRTRARAGRQ